ncbi:hypothetical protein CNYM01_06367 [Colletotrichum nymphaeae SA-01]|uniref:Uncharacterized protein n=1 Tax=Colletotrichum nymphaeae SA-01 TaxID=1460502 RepID=A0A135TTY1_9PEZI|nr:hypothetical protein CNYM01_06367 [Colletotrichum nymphaeae SA-01]
MHFSKTFLSLAALAISSTTVFANPVAQPAAAAEQLEDRTILSAEETEVVKRAAEILETRQGWTCSFLGDKACQVKNPASNSPAKNITSSFGYMERYGRLTPPREKPTHEFDELEQSISLRINDKYINCFRLVAAGKTTTGTGCGVRIHAFTNDIECKDIATKGKREDVQVTAAPKYKLANEVAGEIMAFKKADLGFGEDNDWVKVLMDKEYKEDVIPQWEDLEERTPNFPREPARSPVEDITSVPLSDVFLRNWASMMDLDIVPDAYPITFLAVTHVRFAVLEIIHPVQFLRRPLPANTVPEPFKRPLEIDCVIGGGGPLAVTRFTDEAPEERRTGRQAGADDVEADFGGRCRVREDGRLADVVRYTGHRTEDPEEKRPGDGDEDYAGKSQSLTRRKEWLDKGAPIPAADQEDACECRLLGPSHLKLPYLVDGKDHSYDVEEDVRE